MLKPTANTSDKYSAIYQAKMDIVKRVQCKSVRNLTPTSICCGPRPGNPGRFPQCWAHLKAFEALSDHNMFDSARTRISPAWGWTGKETFGNSHTLWSHYITSLIVSWCYRTFQTSTFSPYLALRYGMGVFFQRQRQEVLLSSLKTWNTDHCQLFLTRCNLNFPINVMNIFVFLMINWSNYLNVSKISAKRRNRLKQYHAN